MLIFNNLGKLSASYLPTTYQQAIPTISSGKEDLQFLHSLERTEQAAGGSRTSLVPHQLSLKRKSTQLRPPWSLGHFVGFLTVASSSKCGGRENSPERSCSLKLQHDVCSELTKEMPASSSFPWYPPKQTDMQANVLAKPVLAVPRKCHAALRGSPLPTDTQQQASKRELESQTNDYFK